MRRGLLVLLIATQLAVLGYLAGQREWILARGEVVYLRTAPVDPRDPLRGDYVDLSYRLNQQPLSAFRPPLTAPLTRGATVFAVLQVESGDLYQLDYLTLVRPDTGRFLKGRVDYVHHWGTELGREQGVVELSFGIEQLFVEQGRGLDIERRRGSRAGLQVPMEVAVALGAGGVAQLKSFRWSPVGLEFQHLGQGAPRSPDQPPNLTFRLRLHNLSTAPLTLIDGPEHCAFRLAMLPGMGASVAPRAVSCSPQQWQQEQLISLAPGQVHDTVFDLSLARWFVYSPRDGGVWDTIAELAFGQRFRLQYLPGSARGVRADADLLWQPSLETPAFSPRGVID